MRGDQCHVCLSSTVSIKSLHTIRISIFVPKIFSSIASFFVEFVKFVLLIFQIFEFSRQKLRYQPVDFDIDFVRQNSNNFIWDVMYDYFCDLPSLSEDSFSVTLSKKSILLHRNHGLSIECQRRDAFVVIEEMFRAAQNGFQQINHSAIARKMVAYHSDLPSKINGSMTF